MSSICKTDISNVAKDICKVFINSARKIFGVTKNVQVSKNKPWFNRDCRNARKNNSTQPNDFKIDTPQKKTKTILKQQVKPTNAPWTSVKTTIQTN